MKSLPFTAKVGKVVQQVSSDLLQLPKSESDIAQQPYLAKVAEQFEARVAITWTCGGR
jgi:hypothetical protein